MESPFVLSVWAVCIGLGLLSAWGNRDFGKDYTDKQVVCPINRFHVPSRGQQLFQIVELVILCLALRTDAQKVEAMSHHLVAALVGYLLGPFAQPIDIPVCHA